MIDPGVKQSANKVAEAMTLMSRRLTDAANSDDEAVLEKTLTDIADLLEQAGSMLAMGLKGKSEPAFHSAVPA